MILKLIDWFLARRGERRIKQSSVILEIAANVQEIASAAIPLISEMDKKPFRGGYKRRQVEAKLFRLFPTEPKTDIALAVEVAIRLMRGL